MLRKLLMTVAAMDAVLTATATAAATACASRLRRWRGQHSAAQYAARKHPVHRATADPSEIGALMVQLAREAGGEGKDLFQRRFQQLVAGGWSFRAAIVVTSVETTINSAASKRHFC
jgi:hypothetical protein